jgi:arsenate reductase (glutaredoxin)
MSLTIYHNPRCSKSRATLALLAERGLTPDIIEYLNVPPSAAELGLILDMLGKQPEELMRQGEDEYKQYVAGRGLSRDEAIAVMVAHPKLIERPIVINGDQAAVGRPPEAVLDIL